MKDLIKKAITFFNENTVIWRSGEVLPPDYIESVSMDVQLHQIGATIYFGTCEEAKTKWESIQTMLFSHNRVKYGQGSWYSIPIKWQEWALLGGNIILEEHGLEMIEEYK